MDQRRIQGDQNPVLYAYDGVDRSQVTASGWDVRDIISQYVDRTLDNLPKVDAYLGHERTLEDYARELFSAPEQQQISSLARIALGLHRTRIVDLASRQGPDPEQAKINQSTIQACARAAIASFAALPWALQESRDVQSRSRSYYLGTPDLLRLPDPPSQRRVAYILTAKTLDFLRIALRYNENFLGDYPAALRQPSKSILRPKAKRLGAVCARAADPGRVISTLLREGRLITGSSSKPASSPVSTLPPEARRERLLAEHNEALQKLLNDESLDSAVRDLEPGGDMLAIHLGQIEFTDLGALLTRYGELVGRSLYDKHIDPRSGRPPGLKRAAFNLKEPVGRGRNVFVQETEPGAVGDGTAYELPKGMLAVRRLAFVLDKCIRGKNPEPIIYELIISLKENDTNKVHRDVINIARSASRPGRRRERKLLEELLPLRDAIMRSMDKSAPTEGDF